MRRTPLDAPPLGRFAVTTIDLTSRGMDRLIAKVTRIEKALHSPGMVKRAIGDLLVQQTKRRISVEKTEPSGRPWARWSPSYAATRSAGHSLLIDTGALLNSIKASVTKKSGVSIDSSVAYAGYVQSKRAFLGISKANSNELSTLVQKWMRSI